MKMDGGEGLFTKAITKITLSIRVKKFGVH